MSHHFRNHHIVATMKTNSMGGSVIHHHQVRNGSIVKVKTKRDPRTGKIHYIEDGGSLASILEPVRSTVRKYRNRFSLADVPGALSRALGGDGLIRMM